jgi:Dyp-type peroxidase family
MPVSLDRPLDDTVISPQEKGFLQRLQANIVKGHGRDHVALIFLSVKDLAAARSFLRAWPVSDAYGQLTESDLFKRQGVPGGLVRLAFLSQRGLQRFGHGSKFEAFSSFAAGMAADTAVLDQGRTDSWHPELRQPIDVLLLLAHDDRQTLARVVGKLIKPADDALPHDRLDLGFDVVFLQEGKAQRNHAGEGIEHFGYVDGRSQPLMLRSSIDRELAETPTPGVSRFDPSAPLKQFMLPDPLDPQGHGSFFVFRKLEQNVAGFKAAEAALATRLGLTGEAAERAGALVVGRFEDGTPVTLAPEAQGGSVKNSFNYEHDLAGSKCPFHAHIRKAHPRGASPGGLAFDHAVQMARRGIPYGDRLQDPDTGEFLDLPHDGVGLLFMSYQADLDRQFRFMQTQWVDQENFPQGGVGVDPVLSNKGQLAQTWPTQWGQTAPTASALFNGFVTLRGGEYFYAPSVDGLKAL